MLCSRKFQENQADEQGLGLKRFLLAFGPSREKGDCAHPAISALICVICGLIERIAPGYFAGILCLSGPESPNHEPARA